MAFLLPQTKSISTGLLSWTHPSASRPLEDICTSSVLQAQWGFDMRQKERLCPPALQVQDWGRARGSAPVNPCDRRTRRSRSGGVIDVWGIPDRSVWDLLSCLCVLHVGGSFYLLEVCVCGEMNWWFERAQERQSIPHTTDIYAARLTDGRSVSYQRPAKLSPPIHTVLVYEYRVLMKIRWKTGVELANMLRLSKNLLNGSIMYYKEMGKSSLKHDSSS